MPGRSYLFGLVKLPFGILFRTKKALCFVAKLPHKTKDYKQNFCFILNQTKIMKNYSLFVRWRWRCCTVVLTVFANSLFATSHGRSVDSCRLTVVGDPSFVGMTEMPQQQQQQQITGIVRDSHGPLPGVTISVKNSTAVAISDQYGVYAVVAQPSDTLIFTFVGFKTIEIPANGRNQLNALLVEDATALQEVTVNAGYYTVKDKERTGSIATVKAVDIEKQPVANILGAMQGRMAGVNITQETGLAGGGFSITIRGVNSLREGANAPLYIIDGVPYSSDPISDQQTSTSIPGNGNPMNSINPNDIESLEILKDADATAIYGSRGANGVVLITTRRGQSGKTVFAFSSANSVGKVTRFMNLMNTEQYLAMRNQAFTNDGFTTIPDYAYDVSGTWDANKYTDWQKELIGGDADVTTLQGSVSGGSEQTQYLLSGNFRRESSVFPGSFKYKRGGARFSFDHLSTDRKFKITFSGSYTAQDNDLPWIDFVTLSRQLAPNAPALYNEDGGLNWENSTWVNPLSNLESKTLSRTNDLITNATLSYEILKDFTFKTSLGYTDLQNDESRSVPSTMYDPAYQLGSQYSSIYRLNFMRRSWIAEPQLKWQKELENSRLDLLVGSTFQQQTSGKLSQLGEGFTSNSLLYDMASASIVRTLNNDAIVYKYEAFFGRVNYTLLDKYIVNLTGRRDGSSRFGPGKQFANFGAIGAAWLFYKEKAIADNLGFLSFGKLRGSYGTTGNDQIGDYQFLHTYASSGNQYGGQNGLVPARLFNAGFGWETNSKLEGALELGFFKDRVFITAATYRNKSSNQLVGLPLPGTTGFTSIQANLDATVQNTGFETTLTTVNVKTDDFQWSTDLNFTKAQNELISFLGLESSSYRNDYVVGQPTTIRKLFHFTGVDSQTGLYQFEDVNGDGVISFADDRQTVKDFNPDFYGGLQNQLHYKGLQLDFLFQFVKQQNFNFAHTQRYTGLMGNQPVQYIDSWQQPGDNAPYQLFTTGVNQAAMQASEQFAFSDGAVSDASFIRLKNVSLSYDLPKRMVSGIGCRLSFTAQNLLTITSYKGADPEFTQPGSLPPLRILSGGVHLTF